MTACLAQQGDSSRPGRFGGLGIEAAVQGTWQFLRTGVDENLTRRFDVRGIPTLLVFRDGELVDRLYSRDAKTMRQVIDFVARQVSPGS